MELQLQSHTGKVERVKRLTSTNFEFTLSNIDGEPKIRKVVTKFSEFMANAYIGKEISVTWEVGKDRVMGLKLVK